MKKIKSQTATEYLIIVAVVIVIAVVVAGLMGGLPGIGSGTNKKVADYKLANDVVGIESYNIGTDSSLFKLKNNYYETITVSEFRVNQQENLTCNSSNTNPTLPIVLNVGQSQLINCSVVNSTSYSISSKQTPKIGISYIDNIGATRTAGNVESYGAITTSNEAPEEPLVCNDSATFHNGTGTAQAPYGICNWAQLDNVRDDLDAHYILLDDLDSNTANYFGLGDNWIPIGHGDIYDEEYNFIESAEDPFSGNFNGNGKTISNLTINLPGTNDIGLFGVVTGNLSDVNLNVNDVAGGLYVGGLVGSQNSGKISNCYLRGTVHGMYYIGGIAGNNRGVIIDSYSEAIVTADGGDTIGGITAENYGNIINCSYLGAGDWSGVYGSLAGGITANNFGNIINSSSSGYVEGSDRTGGIASYNTGNISNSVVTGNIQGASPTGGVVGLNQGIISNCSSKLGYFYGYSSVGGLVGYNYHTGRIFNSSANFSVDFSGDFDTFGGLVGMNAGLINDSFAIISGSISTSYNNVGGLVGQSDRGQINNCFTIVSGTIYSDQGYVGGLVGLLGYGGGEIITNSYAIISGTISTPSSYAGGLVGSNLRGTIINSTVIISGIISAGDSAGALSGLNMGLSSDYGPGGVINNSYAILEPSAIVTAPAKLGFIGDDSYGGFENLGSVSNSHLIIRNATYGNITFLEWNVTNPAGGNLLDSIYINNKLAHVDSSIAGYNKSANITFTNHGLGTITNMLYDGNVCNAGTSPICINLTSMTADPFRFNVSYWPAGGNFSIS